MLVERVVYRILVVERRSCWRVILRRRRSFSGEVIFARRLYDLSGQLLHHRVRLEETTLIFDKLVGFAYVISFLDWS